MASESSDISLRFQQVTRQSAEQHEEQSFLHLKVEELDHHKIDFGKEKKGQTYKNFSFYSGVGTATRVGNICALFCTCCSNTLLAMNLHALLECALWRLLLAMNLQAQLKLAQEKSSSYS